MLCPYALDALSDPMTVALGYLQYAQMLPPDDPRVARALARAEWAMLRLLAQATGAPFTRPWPADAAHAD